MICHSFGTLVFANTRMVMWNSKFCNSAVQVWYGHVGMVNIL